MHDILQESSMLPKYGNGFFIEISIAILTYAWAGNRMAKGLNYAFLLLWLDKGRYITRDNGHK